MGSVFGTYLRALRKQRSLKLNEAAFGLKVDPTLLSKYELGTRFPKTNRLIRIAKFYRIGRDGLAKKIAKDKEREHYRRLSSHPPRRTSKRRSPSSKRVT
jgi:transcriptional regulator with XRE-family HTH domain